MKILDDGIKKPVRHAMRGVAMFLDRVSGGRITPNIVTWTSLAGHVAVMWLIATGRLELAAVGLIVFGLLDTVDGELARLQGSATDAGGMLDAVTDRLKETMLYSGIAYLFAVTHQSPEFVALAVAACGASICVSFVKSKGETIIAAQGKKLSYAQLNRLFGGGLFPFEVRMAVLAAGLLIGQTVLIWAVLVLAIMSTITVFQRLDRISKGIIEGRAGDRS